MKTSEALFSGAWTQGDLSQIQIITGPVGTFAMWVISIGGFFMVVLPLIRNVINGIVVVAPGLCDKIDQAHKTKLGLNQAEGGNQIQMVVGSFMTILLSLVPNFKAISDFDEGIKDPKSFMMTAIPKMCIYIFIGVFIYSGYPAIVAQKFSDGATSIIDMALNNVNPEVWAEKLPSKLSRPDFSTSDATDTLSVNTNKMSKELWGALTSKYTDLSKDNRTSLSHEVEKYCNGILSQVMDKSDSKLYKMSAEARVMNYDPQLNNKAQFPNGAYDDKEHIWVYQTKAPVTGNFNIGVPGGTDGDYFMVTIKFYEVPKENETADNVQCIAVVGQNQVSGSDTSNTCTWTTDVGAFTFDGTIVVNGYEGSVGSPDIQGGKKRYKITFNCSKSELLASSSNGGRTSGIYASQSGTAGPHTVTRVEFGGTSGTTFKPVDDTKWNSWGIGGTPTPKDSGSNNGR